MNLMNIQNRISQLILVLLLAIFSSVVVAEPQMGKDFKKTAREIPTEAGNKIEVIEVFWYGCPHCYAMDPVLNKWVEQLPEDVVFKRIPGLPQPQWEPMAKAYYAMEDLGVLEKHHTDLFEAIHGENGFKRIALDDKVAIAWLSKISGIDKEKVKAAFYSFSMRSRLTQARNFFRSSGATGVPSLVIDGRYITSSTMAGNNENALVTADYIIENVRKAKAAN